jgi:O-methyltransferase
MRDEMEILRKVRRVLRRPTLSDVSRAVIDDRLTYLSTIKLERIEQALREVDNNGVPGDVVEFGVALGGSGIIMAKLSGPSRRYLGLDVFEMIPPPTSDKDDAKSKERFETIASGKSTGIGGDTYYGYRDNLIEDVRKSFSRHGVPVDGSRVLLIKGLFEDSWPSVAVDRIALAHIDCDWYDPVRFCLQAIADKLSDGGIVILDDYYDYGGCRTAVDEFVAERPDFRFEDGRNPFLRKRG